MPIGILKVYLAVDHVQSLKEKRSLIQPLLNDLRNNYNVSVSELDGRDDLHSSTLGIAHISEDGRKSNRKLSKIVNKVERVRGFRLLDYTLEVF
ncbi:MAG: DUF503 domain-containing protein [Candidatus Acetothermia bacterium]